MYKSQASLWAEWLGGYLGRAFGLPIPPFCIAEVPAALIRECPPELRALGNGPASAEVLAALNSRAVHPATLVREHVAWALSRLSATSSAPAPRA